MNPVVLKQCKFIFPVSGSKVWFASSWTKIKVPAAFALLRGLREESVAAPWDSLEYWIP